MNPKRLAASIAIGGAVLIGPTAAAAQETYVGGQPPAVGATDTGTAVMGVQFEQAPAAGAAQTSTSSTGALARTGVGVATIAAAGAGLVVAGAALRRKAGSSAPA